MYDSFSENVDFWAKTLYTETIETANDIWSNARPYTDEFIEDIRYKLPQQKSFHPLIQQNCFSLLFISVG